MKVNHNKFTLKCFITFIKIILFLSLTSLSFANEKKVGSITEISGTIITITDDLAERDLLIHDPIFINEEIFVTQGSSATIQFNDSTAIIMKELTSLKVSVFENSKLNPKIKAKLLKGQITIESGSIAKNKSGEMVIDVATSTLGLTGTRIDVNLKPDGKSDISLAEDSFGNVGEIKVSSEGQSTNITSVDQVLTVSENNEIVEREKTDEEKNNAKTVSEALIQSSKIDEDEIIQQLEKKLADGNLEDANNDGIINEDDVEATKEIITKEKKLKIDFIVENSRDENTDFLSNIINQSDNKNIGEVIEKIIDTQDNLVEGVVENLSDKDNKFLTTVTTEGAGLIKEKIFETIVAKETDKSAAILSKVMAKSDEATVSSVINNITEKNTNENSKLSLKVMADFSEKSPEKLENFYQNNKEQIQKLTISAVDEAQSSKEDADLIAKVVAGSSDISINNIMEEVSKNSINENQTLSAQVLKAIVDSNSGKIDIINDDVKDTMISQTIQSAQNQQEGTGVQQDQDMTSIVSDIIVNTNTETGSKMIEELNNSSNNSDNDLSLRVISGISEKDTTKLNTLSENNKNQIEELTEKAIKNADASKENAVLIAQVVANVSDELANKVVEEVSKNSTEENQTLSAQVLKAIVDSNSGKIDIINDDVKDTMISQTIESAQNQQEGTGVQQDQDMTSIVSDIIVNTNTETGSKMIEELNNSSTENNLSLKVISGISEKDTTKLNTLSENNKEQMDTLTESAVKNAGASQEDADLIAQVVAEVSDEMANKLISEVTKNSTEENQSLSAKVLKSIVESNPDKMETLSDENKDNMITQTILAAKNQSEGTSTDDIDLTNTIAEIISSSGSEITSKVLEELSNSSQGSDSKLSLQVVNNLTKQENYEEKMEILEVNSPTIGNSISKLVEDAVKNATSEEDLELITSIVEKSKGTIGDKIINSANKNEESKKKITNIIIKVVEKNPEKALEIINKNKDTNTITKIIKNKIENGEAVKTDDFIDVFEKNVSPN